MGSRTGIEALLYLLDEAFGGRGIEASDESQALLPNLTSVPDEAWRTVPDRAARSVESIVVHVGSCKIMYADYAFGGATLEWGTPAVEPWPEGAAPRDQVVPWLEAAHRRLVTHDAYHAGEINHIRSLLHGDDRWRHVQMGF